ncbi:MAG: NYN domain-containing protein, partial [Promethearchaeota archaeon]
NVQAIESSGNDEVDSQEISMGEKDGVTTFISLDGIDIENISAGIDHCLDDGTGRHIPKNNEQNIDVAINYPRIHGEETDGPVVENNDDASTGDNTESDIYEDPNIDVLDQTTESMYENTNIFDENDDIGSVVGDYLLTHKAVPEPVKDDKKKNGHGKSWHHEKRKNAMNQDLPGKYLEKQDKKITFPIQIIKPPSSNNNFEFDEMDSLNDLVPDHQTNFSHNDTGDVPDSIFDISINYDKNLNAEPPATRLKPVESMQQNEPVHANVRQEIGEKIDPDKQSTKSIGFLKENDGIGKPYYTATLTESSKTIEKLNWDKRTQEFEFIEPDEKSQKIEDVESQINHASESTEKLAGTNEKPQLIQHESIEMNDTRFPVLANEIKRPKARERPELNQTPKHAGNIIATSSSRAEPKINSLESGINVNVSILKEKSIEHPPVTWKKEQKNSIPDQQLIRERTQVLRPSTEELINSKLEELLNIVKSQEKKIKSLTKDLMVFKDQVNDRFAQLNIKHQKVQHVTKKLTQRFYHVILIDVNNLVNSAREQSLEFNINDILTKIIKFVKAHDNTFKKESIIGWLFYSKQYKQFIKDAHSPYIDYFNQMVIKAKKYNRQSELNGYQDIDTYMVAEGVKIMMNKKGKIKTLCIVSGDVDYLPLVRMARKSGIHVHVIGFRNTMSSIMNDLADYVGLL